MAEAAVAGSPGAALLAVAYVDARDLTARSALRDLAGAYLQDLRDKERSVDTVENYASYLAELLEFLGRGGRSPRVADLDVRALKAFSSHLSRRSARVAGGAPSRPIAAATRNLHMSAVRGLLRYGVLLDLPVPSADKVERARARQPSPDARHLETDRLKRLLEAPDIKDPKGLRTRALLELLVATGCRISEVMALDRRGVEVAPDAESADGLRVADEITVFGKGGRHRKVFIHKRAREWVARYLRSRKDRDPALFVTNRRKANGSYRMSVWMAQRSVTEAARRAGLAENVTPHWLRHAAITEWASVMDLPAAQRLAGHRQISSTNRYLGGSDRELKERYKRHFG